MAVRSSPLTKLRTGRFPDPLRFDIHRKPKRILPFGAGAHHASMGEAKMDRFADQC